MRPHIKTEADRSLVLAILFLLGLGLVQVYSSSFIFAIESYDDGLFFVKKQAMFVALGLAVLFITAYMPWDLLERVALGLWIVAVICVGLTLIPGVGVRVGGAARWLNVGAGFRVEPSEILKYCYPVLIGHYMTDKTMSPALRAGLLALLMAPLALLLKQPDFGSVAILLLVAFLMAFSRGLKWRYVIASGASLAVAFYVLIVREPYRMARFQAFLDPWADPAKKGFQVIQSMLGFYSGGLTGVGMGQGQGKLYFLPEAHTDFTLSVLGEELGFIGIAIAFTIFGYIVLRGMQTSVRAETDTKRMIALGVTLVFALTATINAGVAMGMLPTKGLGMPFLSYGGSALIANCFGLGILLNIERGQSQSRFKSFIKI